MAAATATPATTGKPLTLDRVQRGELYTPSEVATLFKVDRHTVATWCRKGHLQAGKTPGGGYYRILGSEVLRAWGEMFLTCAPADVPDARQEQQEAEQIVELVKRLKKQHGTKSH